MTKSEDEEVIGLDSLEAVTDDNLTKVIEECIKEQSCLPIIKQELKYTIQYKRLGKGLDELQLQPDQPPVYRLRCDEVKKNHKRKLQNRASSVRCRRRRNEYIRELEETIVTLENEQALLRAEVDTLRKEKDGLHNMAAAHMSSCGKPHPRTQNSGRKMVSLLSPKYLTRCLKT